MLHPQSGRQRFMKQMSQILGNELERLSLSGEAWNGQVLHLIECLISLLDLTFALN